MDNFVTLILVNAALRARYPEIPASETFLLVHRVGDGFRIIGSDEDRPQWLAPIAWARYEAAKRGLAFEEPAEFVGFTFHAGTWSAYDMRSEDDGLVRNPYAERQPAIFLHRREVAV